MNDYTALFTAALEWVKTGRVCPDCGDNWLVIADDGVSCWLCGRRLAKVAHGISPTP